MQMHLHHEDINDALREAILVAGGYKALGAMSKRIEVITARSGG